MAEAIAESLSVGFIDDKADYLDHLVSEQEERHVPTKVTTDPAECLDWIRRDEISVLVADLRMPNKDGLTIVEQAQALRDIEIVLLTGHDPTPFEQQRADALGVSIHRKDSLPELLDDFASDVGNAEMRRLRHREKSLLAAHSIWVEDLIAKLKDIPDLEKTLITSEDGTFTLAELIDDIRELRPRGREYIRLWQRTLDTFLKLGEK